MSDKTKKIVSFFAILMLGILFGIVLTKSEVVSWFRIQEMFRFQSFHMYGVIGTAIAFGIVINQLFLRFETRSFEGVPVKLKTTEPQKVRYLAGGTIFGLGWAMTGACPGPLYTLVGSGYTIYLVTILGALLGTFVYGLLREKLPH